jgi:hypothetical protein
MRIFATLRHNICKTWLKDKFMKKVFLAVLSMGIIHANSQSIGDMWNKTKDEVKKDEKKVEEGIKKGEDAVSNNGGVKAPSNEEIIQGLKEALNHGTNNSTAQVAKVDGYLKNPRLFIPFPPEAEDMKKKLVKIGLEKKVTEFETSLNRAAEEAAKTAAPVFLTAIKNMTVTDGMAILKGSDTSATHYLKGATSTELYSQYKPIVKDAIAKVKVTQYWDPLVKKYNKIPGVKKQNPDLEDYVTRRAMSGLFLLVADEEAKIRKDPAARVNDILKKVFGYADTQKGK